MPGDYTRRTFDPLDDILGVFLQQGRPTVDADVNELVDRLDRRFRVTTRDTVGRAVVPRATQHGFEITDVGGDLEIGAGRAYVDGIAVDNHGAPPRAFEGELEELRSDTAWTYSTQPFGAGALPALPSTGTHLVGLDVWRRERTWAEEPERLDPAFYGIDTASRQQVVWQVRLVDVSGGGGVDCATPDDEIGPWADATAPSAARLTTAAVGVPAVDDPCEVPLTGGYRGVDNRLYRVQVHQPGPLGTATFVWSRDNASLASPVLEITATDTVRVSRVGRDDVSRFAVGDWVEVTDEPTELAGVPGVLREIAHVEPGSATIRFQSALPAGRFDATSPARRTRIVKWDQTVDAGGAPLAAGDIVIDGAAFELEDGVEVTFSLDGGGEFRSGEYWQFAARTASDGQLEVLTAAPPVGPHHHWARLAVWDADNGIVDDCRTLWPPDAGGEGCECTVCVTAESHRTGDMTIQRAVDEVKAAGGGTVCLEPGRYELDRSVFVAGAHSVTIRGTGAATRVVTTEPVPAFVVALAGRIELEELVVGGLHRVGVPAVLVAYAADVAISRCIAVANPLIASFVPTIAVGGIVGQLDVHDNVLLGTVGIGNLFAGLVTAAAGGDWVRSSGLADRGEDVSHRLTGVAGVMATVGRSILGRVFVRNNIVLASGVGVGFIGVVVFTFETTISDNLVVGLLFGGIGLVGVAALASSTTIAGNTVTSLRAGILSSLDHTEISRNRLLGLGALDRSLADVTDVDVEESIPLKGADGSDGLQELFQPVTGSRRTAEVSGVAAIDAVDTTDIVAAAAIIVADAVNPYDRLEDCRVRENVIEQWRGIGIYVQEAFDECDVVDNHVRDVDGVGIVVGGPRQPSGTVRVTGNHVGDVEANTLGALTIAFANAATDNFDQLGTGALAIAVAGAERARISDNLIADFPASGSDTVAIAVASVMTVVVADNSVNTSAGQFFGRSTGVLVTGQFKRADVADNEILQGSVTGSALWTGIRILGRSPAEQAGRTEREAAMLRVVRNWAISRGIPAAEADELVDRSRAIPAGGQVVAVRGNLVEARTITSLVDTTIDGNTMLTENRLIHRLDHSIAPAAALTSGSAIASNNYIESDGRTGLALDVDRQLVTVVGNLSNVPHEVGGAALAAPWDALNPIRP